MPFTGKGGGKMDISSRFSLADFLAYLFPGIFALTAFFFLVMLTPLSTSLANLPTDLTAGILFLVFSYITGVVISGFAEIFTNRFRHKSDFLIPLKGFEQDIKAAFKDVFDIKDDIEWTRVHFYLCRSIVFEHMPNEIQGIQRQNSLRQLRMNMLLPILFWVIAGCSWGWKFYASGTREWGVVLIFASIILGIMLFRVTVDRMQNNDAREVRETLSAFLAGYKTGLFLKQKQPGVKHLQN
jgi:hypothetical protein